MALKGKVEALRTEVEAHRERERALLAAALSNAQMGALADRLEALGLADIARGEQRNGDDLIGHIIEARRQA